MLLYNGFKIPETKEEILKVNDEAQPSIPNIHWTDLDLISIPVNTEIEIDTFRSSTDENRLKEMINKYQSIVKIFIDAYIEHNRI